MAFKCPECDARLKCIDTRSHGLHIHRIYKCDGCGVRLTTNEYMIELKDDAGRTKVQYRCKGMAVPADTLRSV